MWRLADCIRGVCVDDVVKEREICMAKTGLEYLTAALYAIRSRLCVYIRTAFGATKHHIKGRVKILDEKGLYCIIHSLSKTAT